MAIIGQSKNSDLYQKVTTEGTKYRGIKYSDVSDTEPLIVKELPDLDDKTGGAGFIPDVTREVTTRIDDTVRITKLLTKYQGIKWQGHNAALTAIQNELDSKRGRYAGNSDNQGTLLGTLLNVGRGALKALDLDAVTLAQVAVAGTGEHFTAWQSRAYINDADTFGGVIGNVLAQLGLGSGDGSAAQLAITTGKVLINPDNINGRQLPDTDNEALKEAQKPKDGHTGTPIEGIDNTVNGYRFKIVNGQEISWALKNEWSDNGPKQYQRQGDNGLYTKTVTGELEEAQKPRLGHNNLQAKIGVTDRPDEQAVGLGMTHTLYGANRYEDSESGSYEGELKEVKGIDLSVNPGGIYSIIQSEIGPWKPEGIQSLISARSNDSKPAPSDGGNSNDTVTFRDRWTRGDASTRVDNGRIEMIPFYIRAICPGDTGQYGSGKAPSGENGYLFFEANLDSYSDNYDASWEGTQYIGRADKFWNYTGFDRQISFSFKMVAHSKSHLRPIYNRLNGLLSMTTPTYGTQADGGSFMRGTLAEITIGDLLSQQLGFIKSVGLKWETDYMWETDTETIMVPHVLDVSVNFTPIHRFVPHTDLRYFQLVNSGSGDVDTFIVNHNVLYKK